MPSKIKVLCVSPNLSQGGAERNLSAHMQFLDRDRFSLDLILFNDEVTYPIPDDVEKHVLGDTRGFRKFGVIRRLARWIDDHRPDVVLTRFWHPTMIAGEGIRYATHKPAFVATIAADPKTSSTSRGLNGLWTRRNYRLVDRMLCVSEGLVQPTIDLFPFLAGRTTALHNPMNFERIDRLSEDLSEYEEFDKKTSKPAFTLITVARLEPQKRLDIMIDVVDRVRQQLDLRLIIFGEGSLRAKVLADIKRRKLDDHVILMGYQANPFPWIKHADLFLLTSDYEGLPGVLIQAQGLGIPVVSTRCPHGPEEIVVDGESGILVPTGDVPGLTGAVLELLPDAERRARMGKLGRETVRIRFSPNSISSRMARILAEAANRL